MPMENPDIQKERQDIEDLSIDRPTSSELWELQHKFNRKFWETKGGWPRGEEALTLATKDYAIHMIREVSEVLDELNSKMHRAPTKQLDRSNILEEIIDCQKFLWGIAQLWGFTEAEFINEFKRKSMVVEQRFAQEQQFATLKQKPVVIVDIDGVLAEYPGGFYDWMMLEYDYPIRYTAQKYYESLPMRDRLAIKRRYRMSGFKRQLPLIKGASEMLRTIQLEGLGIVLLTNRPYAEHYRIYPDTLEWLEKHNLHYDAILWARDKGIEAVKHFDNICWAVDDEDSNILRLQRAGITTVKIDQYDPKRNTEAFADFLKSCRRDAVLLANAGSVWNAAPIGAYR